MIDEIQDERIEMLERKFEKLAGAYNGIGRNIAELRSAFRASESEEARIPQEEFLTEIGRIGLFGPMGEKVLEEGAQVSYLPEGSWERTVENGIVTYTVVEGAITAQVLVKHADKNKPDQTHPSKGNYKEGDSVLRDGTTMHFPS